MDEAEYHRLRLKISRRFVTISKDKRPESIEDAVQWILSEWWRRGDGETFKRGQTVDQAVVEYLRAHVGGRKGKPGYEERIALENAIPVEKVSPYLEAPKSKGNGDFRALIRERRAIERAALILYYEWGMSEAEIGNIFGVSESRVSQRLQRIRQRVREDAEEKARSKGKRVREFPKVLPQETKRELRRVEQREAKKVEEAEPRALESFDEESW